MANGGVDICAGQEDGGLRGLDHEFDKRIWVPGPLNGREGPHRDVVQVAMFKTCKCKKDSKESLTFGTCFLAKTVEAAEETPIVLNAAEDEYACFFTVAHNLYCLDHACYVAKIALVHMNKPGTPAESERTPRTIPKFLSHNNTFGFYRVPQEFKQCKTRDGLCQSDYGLIVVCREQLRDLDLKNISLSLPTSLEAYYLHGVVCGYPVSVYQKPNIKDYNLTGVKAEFEVQEDVMRYTVVGAQYCSECSASSDPVKESVARGQSKEDHQSQRQSNGIFSFPEEHFDKELQDNHPTSSARKALYRHYIDTSGGNSGSPVYVPMQDGTPGTPKFVVVGIHRGTWYYHHKNDVDRATDCNVAVRLTDTILEEMKKWLENIDSSDDDGDNNGSGDDGGESGPLLDDTSHIVMAVESLPFFQGLPQADGKSNVMDSNNTKKVEQSGTSNLSIIATGNGMATGSGG
eukprot:scpid74579/ scgid27699/ 